MTSVKLDDGLRNEIQTVVADYVSRLLSERAADTSLLPARDGAVSARQVSAKAPISGHARPLTARQANNSDVAAVADRGQADRQKQTSTSEDQFEQQKARAKTATAGNRSVWQVYRKEETPEDLRSHWISWPSASTPIPSNRPASVYRMEREITTERLMENMPELTEEEQTRERPDSSTQFPLPRQPSASRPPSRTLSRSARPATSKLPKVASANRGRTNQLAQLSVDNLPTIPQSQDSADPKPMFDKWYQRAPDVEKELVSQFFTALDSQTHSEQKRYDAFRPQAAYAPRGPGGQHVRPQMQAQSATYGNRAAGKWPIPAQGGANNDRRWLGQASSYSHPKATWHVQAPLGKEPGQSCVQFVGTPVRNSFQIRPDWASEGLSLRKVKTFYNHNQRFSVPYPHP